MDFFDTHIPMAEIALRMGVALGLGLLIGLEREWRRKAAGLRTNMLVALGSCVFLIVGLEILESSNEKTSQIDPTRIIEGIIGGIGFLGAGSIIRSGGDIRGLTTGAAIWTAGAVGVACGAGRFGIAILLTAAIIFTLFVVGALEPRAEKIVKDRKGKEDA
jgi:putative Mg2+ transporter-C (MgtC) family protein